ncbi:hypothetical protein [Poseidonocella sedimentorum]|uniref:Uncharacterized protein n=1 Tax=Poseidonocella sedimentorum TaxID=871652 RepID=A0A1I6CMQ7_9RHOB|nr:hypothetical protein [Poseidonocella sedimentorum]SFQ94450.1 hypothetical protein SAMN04515673_10115 [Poseidonocella sedimentorum]
MKFLYALGLALALAASPATAQDAEIPVGKTWEGVGVSWTGGGRFFVRWTVMEQGGKLKVCGAATGTGTGRYGMKFNRELLRVSEVQRDGKAILRDLRFINLVSSKNLINDLAGVPATCKVTSAAPNGSSNYAIISKTSKIRVQK